MATWLIVLIIIGVLSILDDLIELFASKKFSNNTSTIITSNNNKTRVFINGKLVSETIDKKD